MQIDTNDAAVAALRPRAELLRRRDVRNAWLLVVVGLLVPFLAAWGAAIGLRLRGEDDGGHLALITVGASVFVVRLALFFTGTWP